MKHDICKQSKKTLCDRQKYFAAEVTPDADEIEKNIAREIDAGVAWQQFDYQKLEALKIIGNLDETNSGAKTVGKQYFDLSELQKEMQNETFGNGTKNLWKFATHLMKSGKLYMNQGNYAAASVYFYRILEWVVQYCLV